MRHEIRYYVKQKNRENLGIFDFKINYLFIFFNLSIISFLMIEIFMNILEPNAMRAARKRLSPILSPKNAKKCSNFKIKKDKFYHFIARNNELTSSTVMRE